MSATSQGQKRRWVLRFRPELLYENLRLFLFIYAKLEINIDMSKNNLVFLSTFRIIDFRRRYFRSEMKSKKSFFCFAFHSLIRIFAS